MLGGVRSAPPCFSALFHVIIGKGKILGAESSTLDRSLWSCVGNAVSHDCCCRTHFRLDASKLRAGTRTARLPRSAHSSRALTTDSDTDFGVKLYHEGQVDRALDVFTQALRKYDSVARSLVNLARCCLELGKESSAVDYAVTGLTVDPSNENAWFLAARGLKNLGKTSEARALIDLAPERAKIRSSLVLAGKSNRLTVPPAFLTFQTNSPVKPPSSFELDDSGRRRRLGHSLWREGKRDSALDAYKADVWGTAGKIVPILAMRSSCYLYNSDPYRAAVDIAAALVLDSGIDPEFSASLITTRIRALKALHLEGPAAEMYSILDSTMAKLKVNKGGGGEGPTISLNKDKLMGKASRKDNQVDATQDMLVWQQHDYKWFESILEKMKGGETGIERFDKDNRVPRFHVEFNWDRHLPHYANYLRCSHWLECIHKECVFQVNRFELYKAIGGNGAAPSEIWRRFGGTKQWWQFAPPGDVLPDPPRMEYSDDLLDTFGSVPMAPIDMVYGKTHVAVGYGDLGVLLSANFVGKESSGPVRFVGFDPSVASMAKALVFVQMMKNGAPSPEILQAMYSSAWCYDCLVKFRNAIDDLVGSCSWEIPLEVLDLLRHWRGVPMADIKRSNGEWLDLHNALDCLPANIVRPRDRDGVLRYYLTGELLHASVGSPVMFQNLPTMPDIARNELVFSIILEEELGRVLANNKDATLMDAVVEILTKKIDTLKARVMSGQVVCEFKWTGIHPSHSESQEQIREMDPQCIVWSNLSDYVSAADFHSMAKNSSSRGTIHHGFSLQWLWEVKGTFLLDFESLEKKAELLSVCQVRYKSMIKKTGLEGILATPPIDNPHSVGFALAGEYFDRWWDRFVEGVAVAENRALAKQVLPYSAFNKNGGTAYFSFVYEDDVEGDDQETMLLEP